MSFKRAGLLAAILFILIIGIEGTLSLVRQRNLYFEFRTEGTQPALAGLPTATPGPSPVPGGNTAAGTSNAPAAGSIIISTDGAVLIDMSWDYRIGPRFPITRVRAQVATKVGDPVASGVFTIDCGTETLSCKGNHTFSLRFGLVDGQPAPSEQKPWPVGEYVLRLTRDEGLMEILAERPVIVAQ